jgi:glycosyltransferase involved in cell wall biosynthesis
MERAGPEKERVVPPFVDTDKDCLDFTRRRHETLHLKMSPEVLKGNYYLVIDLYSAANPVHPQGHLGWWACDLGANKELRATLSRRNGGFAVTFDGRACPEGKSWANPDRTDWRREGVLALHVVLRSSDNKALVFDEVINLYQDKASLQAARAACGEVEKALPPTTRTVPRWYCWPRGTRAFVLARDIYEGDAVGNFAIGLGKFLKTHGVVSRLGAANFNPQLRGVIQPMGRLLSEIREQDLLLFNASTYDPYMEAISALPARKILCYHNITPPRFFQIYDAERAMLCAKAMEQLALAARFDCWTANSSVSVEQLSRAVALSAATAVQPAPKIPVVVIPPLINALKWDQVKAEEVALPDQGDMLLHVGRLAPNKRIEDLFALFQEYLRLNPKSWLIVVGRQLFKGYDNYLNYLLLHRYRRIGRRIRFLQTLTDGQLKTAYLRCSALVTMSEHEGFCLPVVEAMHFRKPVFAYAEPAVRETLGQAGRLFYHKDFPAIAAEVHALLRDGAQCESMVEGQYRRFQTLASQAEGRALWEAIEKVLFPREDTL